MPGKPKLSPRQTKAMYADIGAGLPTAAVAAKYNRTIRTVGLMRRELRQSETKPEVILQHTDWKQELKDLGISAVRSGLICSDDPYKQADIGVKTLKGLGEFSPDDSTVINLMAGIPTDWRERYLRPVEQAQIGEGSPGTNGTKATDK